ncbi:MAG: DUF2157 domain-containing protein [Alphaproteobacteria bacterium]|nr:DUF2157 domain-containing protein [Alphaproteobacteria bacterium]
MSRREAQERIKRIFAFRDELSELQDKNVIALSCADQDAIAAYHRDLLEEYSSAYDTDLTKSESQLSWGMRAASTLGAVAFALGVFMFFEHYWESFSTAVQVGLATAAPFIGWALSEAVAYRYKTPHYTSLAVLVAIACFVMNLIILGIVFNIATSPNAFLAWGLFGMMLAYRHDLAVVLGISLIGLSIFAGGFLTNLTGFAWPATTIPEFYLAAGILCLAAAILIKSSVVGRYRNVFFLVGLIQIYCILTWLSSLPNDSILPLSDLLIEGLYTSIAFIAGVAGVHQCIRAEWAVEAYLSAVFLAIFMLLKYFDWFWDDLPRYIFFLILGVVAIATIASLRRMRSMLRSAER